MPARRKILIILAASTLLSTPALAQDGGGTGGAGAEGGDTGGLPDGYTPTSRISKIRGLEKSSSGTSTYRVKPGDTLWDITARFFETPYLWPALWSYNPQITNPHWIYPDDIVFLRPPAEAEESGAAELLGVTREAGIMVLMAGFYTTQEVDDAPTIGFSPEEKSLITLTDEVYLEFEEDERDKVKTGQRYAIMKKVGEIKDPEDDEKTVAIKLRLVGTTEIIYSDGETLPTGRIVDAYYEIERGDLLFEYDKQLARVLDRPAEKKLKGQIMDSLEIVTTLGEQQFVFVNLGTEDGLKNGNKLLAFEQRDGLLDLPDADELDEEERENQKTRDDLPRRRIGEILVVRATKQYATGLVIDSVREISIGQDVIVIGQE